MMLSSSPVIDQEGIPMKTHPASKPPVRNCPHTRARFLLRPQLLTRS
jgi:hypothetical protein